MLNIGAILARSTVAMPNVGRRVARRRAQPERLLCETPSKRPALAAAVRGNRRDRAFRRLAASHIPRIDTRYGPYLNAKGVA